MADFPRGSAQCENQPARQSWRGAVNAVESDRLRRSKPLRDVATPRRFIFEALQKGGVIPHSGRKEDSCLLHSGELHDMETCLGVEELLQRMIDQGRLEVGSEGKEEQHICMCHTLISSGDLCLMTCDLSLVLVGCLASIIRQFVKFQDMPKNQKILMHNL